MLPYSDTCIIVTIVHSIVVQLIDKLVHPVLWEIVRVKSEVLSLQNIIIQNLSTINHLTTSHFRILCTLHRPMCTALTYRAYSIVILCMHNMNIST